MLGDAYNIWLSQKQGGRDGVLPDDPITKPTDGITSYTDPWQAQSFSIPKPTFAPIPITTDTQTVEVVETSTSVAIKTTTELHSATEISSLASQSQTTLQNTLQNTLQTSIYTSSGHLITVTATVTYSPLHSSFPTQNPQQAHPTGGPGSFSSSNQTQNSNSNSDTHQAAVIGSVIAVIAILAAAFFLAAWYLRRRRDRIHEVDEMTAHRPYFAFPATPSSSRLASSEESPFGDHNVISPLPPAEAFLREPRSPFDETGPGEGMSGSGLESPSSRSRPGLGRAAVPWNMDASLLEVAQNDAEIRNSMHDSSSTPVHGFGQIARPYFGAAIVSVPGTGMLPSYEESQNRIREREVAMPQATTVAAARMDYERHDELEAEYEAETARMAGFGAPQGTLDAQREVGVAIGGSARRLPHLVDQRQRTSKRASSGVWPEDQKR